MFPGCVSACLVIYCPPILMDSITIIDFPFAEGSIKSWHGTVTVPSLSKTGGPVHDIPVLGAGGVSFTVLEAWGDV